MGVELTLLHALYILCLLTIITFFILRKDTTIICIVFIFLLALTATSSIPLAISGIFQSFIYAITELLPTILIISIIVSMSNLLVHTGINDTIISPFTKMIRTPTLAYWIIGLLMMTISFFFWPSPAVALMGAILLPVAVRVGLPPIGVAIAMNLFGHGIALSGGFVIQGAPKLTADAAGLPVSSVVSASVPLVIVMGILTTSVAFFFLRKEFHTGLSLQYSSSSTEPSKTTILLSPRIKKWLAICIPIVYIIDILCMIQFKLQGSDATALIGGTTVIIIIIISLIAYKGNGLNKTTDYFIEGLQFGFKIFGPVIPIAALFYLGDSGFVKIIGDYFTVRKGSLATVCLHLAFCCFFVLQRSLNVMEKKRIDVIATKESFHNLSSFKDVEELNKTVRAYRDTIRMSIKRTDVQSKLITLLEILKRHSCKYVGVSFLCKNRIAEKMEVSYKTVQRLMKKLVDLDMIKQAAMKRTKDMLQTSNAIIIKPIVEEVSDKVDTKSPTKCPTIKTTTKTLKQNIKDINKRNSNENNTTLEENIKEADFVAHWVPERFVSVVNSFYSDSKTIQELWQVVRQCNKVTNFSTGNKPFTKDQELTIGLKAIKEFVMKIKSGAKMKNGKFAYFNGNVNNLMDKLDYIKANIL